MRQYTCLLMLCIGCDEASRMPDIETLHVAGVSAPNVIVEKREPTVEVTKTIKSEPEVTLVSPVPEDEWTNEAKLWLARSLIGEVGWDRPAEQSAVAWVYANRAKKLEQYTFLGMVKTYSAAVRKQGQQRQPWVFELHFNGNKPKYWPSYIEWKGRHAQYWMDTLELIDRWQAGKVPNYCPTANHFGSYSDSFRAEGLRWTRIKCIVPEGDKRFRNRFYDSTTIRPRREKYRRS